MMSQPRHHMMTVRHPEKGPYLIAIVVSPAGIHEKQFDAVATVYLPNESVFWGQAADTRWYWQPMAAALSVRYGEVGLEYTSLKHYKPVGTITPLVRTEPCPSCGRGYDDQAEVAKGVAARQALCAGVDKGAGKSA